MLNRILVPLDGTPTGEAALPYAEALARRSGALLVLTTPYMPVSRAISP
jgi:nucleotide-binding universal stress UspA family protein